VRANSPLIGRGIAIGENWAGWYGKVLAQAPVFIFKARTKVSTFGWVVLGFLALIGMYMIIMWWWSD